MSDERVVIFIDGSNFYHCLKDAFGEAKIDFEKLAQKLVGDRKLIRIYYYNAPVRREDDEDRYQRQQKFFSRLHAIPYLTIKLGRLEKRGSTVVEKGVDISIAVDMLRYAYNNAYDTAILISGDGDFASVVEAAKDRGKHIEVAFTKPGQSYHLRNACDRFVLLDEEFLAECWQQ